jgi:hypothetical protein
MTISEKFENATAFITYVEDTFGLGVVDSKVSTFFNNNKDLPFSFTGILMAIKKL